MPIYEYRCAGCGHELEALQKLADAPLKDCPSCGQSKLSKLVSAAGFRLKGSGWYATDFKSRSKTADKSNGESGKSESKSESKSEPAVATAEGAAAKPAASEAKVASKPVTNGGGSCH